MKTKGTCRECPEPIANSGCCRYHYNGYMRTYNAQRYAKRRLEAIERMGGRCVDCGSVERLEFDHVRREEKTFAVADILLGETGRLNEELSKCVLRCKSCHSQKTLLEDPKAVPHGGGATGKHRCRCEACVARKREYNINYQSTYTRRSRAKSAPV